MAPPVEWSPEAVEDVEAIAAWIERDSPAYARAVVGRIVDRAASFAIFPERGRIVPELGDAAVRERFVHGWRLIYRVERTRTDPRRDPRPTPPRPRHRSSGQGVMCRGISAS